MLKFALQKYSILLYRDPESESRSEFSPTCPKLKIFGIFGLKREFGLGPIETSTAYVIVLFKHDYISVNSIF